MKKIVGIDKNEALLILKKKVQYLKMDSGMPKADGFESREVSLKISKKMLTDLCLSIMDGTLNVRNTDFEEELYKHGKLVNLLVEKKKSGSENLIKLTSEAKMIYDDNGKQECIHLPKWEDLIPLEYQTIMYSQRLLSLLVNYYYANEVPEKKNNPQLKLIKGGKK